MSSSLYNKLVQINNIKQDKITTSNIKSGVNIYGIDGTFTSDGTAIYEDISEGKVAYVNGQKVTGILREFNANTINIPFQTMTDDRTNQIIHQRFNSSYNISDIEDERINVGNSIIRDNSYTNITYNSLSSLLGINNADIKKGVRILDIEGLYDASTEFNGIKMDPIIASQSSTSLTSSIREVSGLDMVNGINLSSYFSELNSLTMISNLNTPNVTNLSSFCQGCYSLQNFSYVNFYGDTQTDVKIYQIFNGCRNLEKLDNTVVFPKAISNITRAFQYCYNLQHIDSEIDVTNISNLYATFNMCNNLRNINNLKLAKDKPISFAYTFYNCQNLDITSIDFNNVNVSDSSYMFSGVKSIDDNTIGNLFNDTSNFKISSGVFSNTSITKIPNFRLYDNVYFDQQSLAVFSGCNNITNIDYNMSTNVSGLSYMLSNCINLETVNFSIGNNVSNMDSMFYDCINLKTVNLYMNAQNSNQNIRLSKLVCGCNNLIDFNMNDYINNVTNCNEMFCFCENLVDINLKFNTISGSTFAMFYNCFKLKTFNFGNATFDMISDTSNMFANCYNLTSIGTEYLNLSNIDGSVTNMFTSCVNLHGNLVMNISSTSASSSQNNIFKGCGFDNISLYFDCYSNRKLNMYSVISGCPNLQSANLSINSFNTRANNAEIQIVSCPNLSHSNVNLYCISNDMNLTYSGCNQLSDVNINMQIEETGSIIFEQCNNLHNSNIYTNNTSNLSLFYSRCIVYNLPNINSYNYCNINNLDFSSCEFYNNRLSVNHNNILRISSFRMSYCDTVEDIDFIANNCMNLSNFFIGPSTNLVNLNVNLPNIENIGVMNIYNAKNLSDNSYDSIMGILANVNYGSNKHITNVFHTSGKNSDYWQTLPNYNNLINAGWSI